MVSRNAFRECLEGVLKRLAVLPSTATMATELLDARAAAKRRTAALVKTPAGRQRLADAVAALGPAPDADARALAMLEDEQYEAVVSKVFVSSGSEAVAVAEQEASAARSRADRMFQVCVGMGGGGRGRGVCV